MTPRSADPFERAVAREERLRERASVFDSPRRMMRLVFAWYGVLGAGWALLLAGHWALFADPRWLAVLHTVVFALVAGCALATAAFMTFLRRRAPHLFDDE